MKDQKFLLWLHDRMVRDGFNPDYDFMLSNRSGTGNTKRSQPETRINVQ